MATADSISALRAPKPPALDIDAEVAALKRMTVTELKRKYDDVFDEACRSGNKQWLIRRIAWRLQANAEGDLSVRARQRALELADDADLRLKAPKQPVAKPVTQSKDDPRIPPPGGILAREYKGKEVHVIVCANGFEYEGQVYKSLSAAAKAITGSHTSGFLFFGLQGGKK